MIDSWLSWATPSPKKPTILNPCNTVWSLVKQNYSPIETDYHQSILGPTQAHRGKIQDLIGPQVAGLHRKIYRKIMHGAGRSWKGKAQRCVWGGGETPTTVLVSAA